MTTLSSTVGTVSVSSTSSLIADEDCDKMKEKAGSVAATSLVVSATTLGAQTVNNTRIKEMHDKYATTYVESMSNEQLVAALEQLNLLEASMTNNNNTKTI